MTWSWWRWGWNKSKLCGATIQDLEKLKDSEVADLFETTIGGKFAALTCWKKTETISERTSVLHSSTLHLKYLASQEEDALDDQRHSGYVTEEVVASKKEGPLAMQNYCQVNQVIRRIKWNLDTWPLSRNWLWNQNRKQQGGFQNTLKLLTQRQQTKTNLIENTKGKLLTEDKVIHLRWTAYYMEAVQCTITD